MARDAETFRHIAPLLFGVLLWWSSAPAQNLLPLEQACSRKPPDFAPAFEGAVVAVRGTIAAPPVDQVSFVHLPIQDEAGYGLMLEGSRASFSGVRPGDRVEARGTIARRAGLPVLALTGIGILAHGAAPSPQALSVERLRSFSHLGRLVVTEARVVESGESEDGEYLLIGDPNRPLKVFLPLKSRQGAPGLAGFDAGDRVRVTGVFSQNCPIPPHNRFFQIVIGNPEAVARLQKRRLISPGLTVGLVAALGLALALWWMRERRLAAQRRIMKALYSLGEEIIGASSAAEILTTIGSVLPKLFRVSGVRLYLYNRGSRSLEPVPGDFRPQDSIPVNAPGGSPPCGAAACFRNQALLTIPDARRSPLFPGPPAAERPRSVMFVPMLAHTELLGVLEIYHNHRTHVFGPHAQVMAQHLANQAALALRLMEEQSIREQLSRSERLAAAGQLISGIAGELRAPLESIARLTELGPARGPEVSLENRLRALAAEAEKASEILARLVSLTRSEPAEASPVDLNALLRSLIEFRRQGWKAHGFVLRDGVGADPLVVLGSQGQLERVFLNLLVYAEQALAGAHEKTLAIGANVLGGRALVEISYGSPEREQAGQPEAPGEAETGVLSEGVCRGIIRSHGGEIRLVRVPPASCRLEVELPVAPAQAGAEIRTRAEQLLSARPLTVLLVEPDEPVRRNTVALLGRRACRVVPASSAEQGAELVERLAFDVVFCSVRLPGLSWLEFFEKVRHHIGAFVLLTEGFDAELSRSFQSGDAYVLAKPLAEPELDRVLMAAAARLSLAQPD